LPPEDFELRHGRFHAAVRPAAGGSLSGFWFRHETGDEVPVLRPAPPGTTAPLSMASFPLVPFCNRIADGTFQWQGRTVRLSPNHPGDALPLHGYGWYVPWQLDAREPARIALRWEHAPDEWPWPFSARAEYALDDAGLELALEIENRGDVPMPAGLGHHPYFPRSPETRLRAYLPWRWEVDARLVPLDRAPNPDAQAFADGARLADLRLDHGYTGWDSHAVIDEPATGLRILLLGEGGNAFHLYVPDTPIYCAEACTNQPNAINDPRAEATMRAVGPGESMRFRMRLDVEPRERAGAL